MTWLQALVMGVVQGLTEFLPISSTAHLYIIPHLLGWPDFGAAVSAVIQLGTTVAVMVYFRSTLREVLLEALVLLRLRRWRALGSSRLSYMALATVPIGVLGLALKSYIENNLRTPLVVAFAAVLFGMLLLLAESRPQGARTLDRLSDVMAIGVAQAFALVPGASRSGTTLTAALAIGLERRSAANFSFLLSIPATALAGLFELKSLVEVRPEPSTWPILLFATAVSGLVGYLCVAWLIRHIAQGSLRWFAYYRIALGVLLLAWAGKAYI